eukprot:scaffold72776_cov69-Phaeocystis_antarctica.AAC.5
MGLQHRGEPYRGAGNLQHAPRQHRADQGGHDLFSRRHRGQLRQVGRLDNLALSEHPSEREKVGVLLAEADERLCKFHVGVAGADGDASRHQRDELTEPLGLERHDLQRVPDDRHLCVRPKQRRIDLHLLIQRHCPHVRHHHEVTVPHQLPNFVHVRNLPQPLDLDRCAARRAQGTLRHLRRHQLRYASLESAFPVCQPRESGGVLELHDKARG